jgi:ribosomal protein L9
MSVSVCNFLHHVNVSIPYNRHFLIAQYVAQTAAAASKEILGCVARSEKKHKSGLVVKQVEV